MKKDPLHSIVAIVIAVILVCSLMSVAALPWWSFVIPQILIGVTLKLLRWRVSGFAVGFWSGFIAWLGPSIVFLSGEGLMLGKFAALVSVNRFLVLLASGFIGGIVSGIAIYCGTQLVGTKKDEQLDLFLP
jgi:hypothetical protein